MKQPVVLVVLGTRPEVIKLWPVIEELRKRDLVVLVESTGQQQDLLEPLLAELGIELKYAPMLRDANVVLRREMFPSPITYFSLSDFLSEAISWLTRRMVEADLVVVQGDTTTALAGALAAFYSKIPIAHVEAGLRTWDLANPFPEEGNRQLISRLATLHFCPTDEAHGNLRAEFAHAEPWSVDPDEATLPELENAYIVGNTVVDAVQRIIARDMLNARTRGQMVNRATPADILVTFHRRESWPEAERVATAIDGLCTADRHVRWVLHANRELASQIRSSCRLIGGPDFVEPMGYCDFIAQLCASKLVITDSGGVVEECVTLGCPCIILRNATERMEALDHGHRLVGLDMLDQLPKIVRELLAADVEPADTFGDGHAAERIAAHIDDFLRREPRS